MEDHQQRKDAYLVENAFEKLLQHARLSKEAKNMKGRADGFHIYQLLRKTFNMLLLQRECKHNQYGMIRQVHSIRRKIIFSSWFNHVHDYLPKMAQAEEFHMRTIFNAFRDVVDSRRGVRIQKKILAQTAPNYEDFFWKRRGIRNWHRFMRQEKQYRSHKILSHEIYMRKIFFAWYENIDRLRLGKSRMIMSNELRKRQALRRGLTALSLHVE